MLKLPPNYIKFVVSLFNRIKQPCHHHELSCSIGVIIFLYHLYYHVIVIIIDDDANNVLKEYDDDDDDNDRKFLSFYMDIFIGMHC